MIKRVGSVAFLVAIVALFFVTLPAMAQAPVLADESVKFDLSSVSPTGSPAVQPTSAYTFFLVSAAPDSVSLPHDCNNSNIYASTVAATDAYTIVGAVFDTNDNGSESVFSRSSDGCASGSPVFPSSSYIFNIYRYCEAKNGYMGLTSAQICALVDPAAWVPSDSNAIVIPPGTTACGAWVYRTGCNLDCSVCYDAEVTGIQFIAYGPSIQTCTTVPDWQLDRAEGDDSWVASDAASVWQIAGYATLTPTAWISAEVLNGGISSWWTVAVAASGSPGDVIEISYGSPNWDFRQAVTLTASELTVYTTTIASREVNQDDLVIRGVTGTVNLDWVCRTRHETYSSPLQWPVMKDYSIYSDKTLNGAAGITFENDGQASVYAVYTGTVDFIYNLYGSNYIYLKHSNGWESVYEADPVVSEGEEVGIGCPIGTPTGEYKLISLYLFYFPYQKPSYPGEAIESISVYPVPLLNAFPDGLCGTTSCLNVNPTFYNKGATWNTSGGAYFSTEYGRDSAVLPSTTVEGNQSSSVWESVTLEPGQYELSVSAARAPCPGEWCTAAPTLQIGLPGGESVEESISADLGDDPREEVAMTRYTYPFTITIAGTYVLSLTHEVEPINTPLKIVVGNACLSYAGATTPLTTTATCAGGEIGLWMRDQADLIAGGGVVISPTGSVYNSVSLAAGTWTGKMRASASSPTTATLELLTTYSVGGAAVTQTQTVRVNSNAEYTFGGLNVATPGTYRVTLQNDGEENLTVTEFCLSRSGDVSGGTLSLGRIPECGTEGSIVPEKYNAEWPGLSLDIGLYFQWLAKMLYDNVAYPILCFLVTLWNIGLGIIELIYNSGIVPLFQTLQNLLTSIYTFLQTLSLASIVGVITSALLSLLGFLLCMIYTLLAWLIARLQIGVNFGGVVINAALAWGLGAVNAGLSQLAYLVNVGLPWGGNVVVNVLVWLNAGLNTMLAWAKTKFLQALYDILGALIYAIITVSDLVKLVVEILSGAWQILTTISTLGSNLIDRLRFAVTGDFVMPLGIESCDDPYNLADDKPLCKIILGMRIVNHGVNRTVGSIIPTLMTIVAIASSAVGITWWSIGEIKSILEQLKLS